MRPRGGLRWSYVPLFVWLKPYPAHAPMLLPEGAVSEEHFITPPDAHLMTVALLQCKRCMRDCPRIPNKDLSNFKSPFKTQVEGN